MSKQNINDSQNNESDQELDASPKSTEIQADSVVTDRDNQKLYENAALLKNQDSPSEQYLKALDPNDSTRLTVEANRFELVDAFAEADEATKSELELKAIANETKDPILEVIRIFSDFISSLAKGDPLREVLNSLRRDQQSERIEEMAREQSQLVPLKVENHTFASLSSPLALAAPEKLEHRQESGKEIDSDSAEKPPSILKIYSCPGVSRKFWERVDNFARQVPHKLQTALVKNQNGKKAPTKVSNMLKIVA